jgi:pimeloyl-ACP methyl ester carboxylesterase
MEPIVMVPGLGSDAAVWARAIAALGPGYDCRVGDTLSDDSLAGMARRILADAPDRFALAGVSMGGMVAMTIMTIAPERVTRLALFDTNARADTPEAIARRRAVNAAMLAATDLRALAAPTIAYMVHPNTPRDVHDALSDMTLRVGAAAYARQNEAVAAREDLSPVLARIGVPTLVAVGADDLMTPVAMARGIADAIPTATLHVIPDCGHLPPIEKPAATAALLRAWMGA